MKSLFAPHSIASVWKENPRKRTLDLAVAALGLVVLSPLFLFLALCIKLDSSGPVFFRGKRMGCDEKIFFILKFRTMRADMPEPGMGITVRNDPRVTRVGNVLRRYKLDELPQLWNVLRGEMSLVGPRPEDPRYLKYYTPAQRVVLSVQPGITGVAALAFRHEEALLQGQDWERTYTQVILPRKLQLELDYMRAQTFWSDLSIVRTTLWAVFRSEEGQHGL